VREDPGGRGNGAVGGCESAVLRKCVIHLAHVLMYSALVCVIIQCQWLSSNLRKFSYS